MLRTISSLDSVIVTLQGLRLTPNTGERIAALLGDVTIDHDELVGIARFETGRYTRNLVYRDADFEILILCWSPESRSPIHDHGSSQCHVAILRGQLRVENFTALAGGQRQGFAHIAPSGSMLLKAGDIDSRTADRNLHRVSAAGTSAISLHVYAKPIDGFLVFNQTERSCEVASAHDD